MDNDRLSQQYCLEQVSNNAALNNRCMTCLPTVWWGRVNALMYCHLKWDSVMAYLFNTMSFPLWRRTIVFPLSLYTGICGRISRGQTKHGVCVRVSVRERERDCFLLPDINKNVWVIKQFTLVYLEFPRVQLRETFQACAKSIQPWHLSKIQQCRVCSGKLCPTSS